MKHKIFFTLLLALIVTIGINGVDIAESFFNDQITEETEITAVQARHTVSFP